MLSPASLAVALLASLLTFGKLSDHIGDRSQTAPTVAVSACLTAVPPARRGARGECSHVADTRLASWHRTMLVGEQAPRRRSGAKGESLKTCSNRRCAVLAARRGQISSFRAGVSITCAIGALKANPTRNQEGATDMEGTDMEKTGDMEETGDMERSH